jgi:methylenetetrahydrofolate reductase (NADPH)
LDTPTFSAEFFPPRTPAGVETLRATWRALGRLRPQFFSCTYGAGGSTRDGTLSAVLDIEADGYCAAPHLCCLGSTRDDLAVLLDQYRHAGIRRLVALRGDLPPGSPAPGDLHHANELVAFIRERTGDHFHIDVGCYPECHPQARSPQDDLENLKRKIEAGADGAITQYFYNADSYFRFVDDCQRLGIEVPIVPGIMPIVNFSQLSRFSDTCGAEIPRWLRVRLQSYDQDSASARSFGLDVVTDLCERLLAGGAPGFHFYTLNQAALTSEILDRLDPAVPVGRVKHAPARVHASEIPSGD